MPDPITIRLAAIADVPDVARLYSAFLDSQFALDDFAVRNDAFDVERWVTRRISAADMRVFVAESEASLVGFCDCSVRDTHGGRRGLDLRGIRPLIRSVLASLNAGQANNYMARRRVGYIHNTFVTEVQRSRGTGGRLVDACLDAMRGDGAEAIYVNTLAANPGAQRLFGAHGFTPESLLLRWRDGRRQY